MTLTFIDSPLTGTYSRKTWSGMADPAGRETIILSDGWNVFCLSRELQR